ncbi:MAG: hypothetical protein ABI233_10995 [Chthoniobacterales bacterium]
MDEAGDRETGGADPELEPRAPVEEDLVAICRRLNALDARYLVVGGIAIIYGGYPRGTNDIDLVIATDLENEERVYRALEILSDRAVRELDPGDVAKYVVARVCDEVVVDLMRSASGIEYEEAATDVVVREVQGVQIPFASHGLLWRMKVHTRREKDAGDLVFLREYFAARGETPPAT